MALPPKDGRNPVKTKDQAATSKKNVALNKAAQVAAWQIKFKKEAPRIDRKINDMGKRVKMIAEMMKRKEDAKKALEDLGDIVLGTLKELKTYTEIQVKPELPKPPVNTTSLAILLPVVIALTAWWKLTKSFR